MKKTVFIFFSGIGLGNSVRVDALLQKVDFENYEILLFTTNNGLIYFDKCSAAKEIIEIRQRGKYPSQRSLFSILKVPAIFILDLLMNCITFAKFYREYKPTFVITDSIYLPVLIFYRDIWYAINNSDKIVRLYKFDKKTGLQFLVEAADFAFHKVFCRTVYSPWFLNSESKLPFISTGSIVREAKLSPQKIQPPYSPLVGIIVYSGSGLSPNFESALDKFDLKFLVFGKEGIDNSRFEYKGTTRNIECYFSNCAFIICNGGFLSLSEALLYRKPILVCPLEWHAEQVVNARTLADLGVAVITRVNELPQRLQELLDSRDRLQDNINRLNSNTDGAQTLVKKLFI